MKCIIRRLRKEDFEGFLKLYKKAISIREEFEGVEPGFHYYYCLMENHQSNYKEFKDEKIYIVTDVKGKILGFANYYYENDYSYLNTTSCVIDNIYVKPKYRRKGIGKKIIEKIVKSAKENADYFTVCEFGKNNLGISFWNSFDMKKDEKFIYELKL